MDEERTHTDGGPLPLWLEEKLADIHQLPTIEWTAQLDDLLARHPEYATRARRVFEAMTSLDGIDAVPDCIGPYRVLEVLGKGGMGIVYLAERRELYQQQVAVKVIKRGMDTESVLRRFEIERQALALMEHDCIAKVLDAGSTREGRPYFVMELVRGIPIQAFCDEHRLSIRQRLELFARVCAAVQHAHQKAIIHRDLTPRNILVTLQDGVPVPKIIDFGLARATGRDLIDATLHTQRGTVHGTPPYMSPEQCGLGPADLDTRTDIYSLGVVLYQLLSGELPFGSVDWSSAGLDQVMAAIRDEEPKQPSTQVAEKAATARCTDPRTLVQSLRGDLDWITMKAIEKDRERRYPSAAAFAEDISRHLDDVPVLAGPPSTAYRLRKFARRHRGVLVTTCLLLLSLLVGGVVSSVYAWRLEAANRQLTAALARSERLAIGDEIDTLRFRGEHTPPWPEHSDLLRRLRNRTAKILEQAAGIDAEIARLRAMQSPQDTGARPAASPPHPDVQQLERLTTAAANLEEQIAHAPNGAVQERAVGRRLARGLKTKVAALRARIAKYARHAVTDPDLVYLQHRFEVQAQKLHDARDHLLPELDRKLAWSQSVQAESIDDHREAWDTTIRSVRADDRFRSLDGRPFELRPQVGLIPLGADPVSGLFEFAHLRSGAVPIRRDGKLVVDQQHGIVFVLLPRGEVRLGVDDHATAAAKNGRPPIRIEPFFLAKHELSRAQWQRLARDTPGFHLFVDGAQDLRNISGDQLAKPLHYFSWYRCRDLLARYGLDLPSEAEWEYACKAGTTWRYYTGDAASSIAAAANVLDQDYVARIPRRLKYRAAEFHDGSAGFDPVFHPRTPNRFGLLHMMGNINEWCSDAPRRARDPRLRAYRGGAYDLPPPFAASTRSNFASPSSRARNLGVRPARRIQQ